MRVLFIDNCIDCSHRGIKKTDPSCKLSKRSGHAAFPIPIWCKLQKLAQPADAFDRAMLGSKDPCPDCAYPPDRRRCLMGIAPPTTDLIVG